ncbi:MAG TPA: UbiA-like polyprenyltransferase [Vicinamibacteria bacterium]
MPSTNSVRHPWDRLLAYGRMIKFSHSVFALPFALAAAALAAREGFRWSQIGWIVVAMVGARSAAMGFNRLADQAIDARNPRTAGRELPRGVLGRSEVWGFVLASAALLVFAAWRLNPLCLALSPVALAVVLGYSYTKRFTALAHLALGLALAIAPVGAWIAVRGRFDREPVVLGLAVLLWVAGFDVIYACQDVDFDRREGLRSIPARLGVARALVLSRAFHVGAVALLLLLYALAPLHPVYLLGVAGVAALLGYEHSLVRADDLSRVDLAFFTLNGWISLGYLAFTLLALWLEPSLQRAV